MKSGMIERRPVESDKRVNLIYLSEQGKSLVEKIRFVSSDVQDDALKNISQQELDVAVSVLARMKENLESVTSTTDRSASEGERLLD